LTLCSMRSCERYHIVYPGRANRACHSHGDVPARD
jgi:hypothetical protein